MNLIMINNPSTIAKTITAARASRIVAAILAPIINPIVTARAINKTAKIISPQQFFLHFLQFLANA